MMKKQMMTILAVILCFGMLEACGRTEYIEPEDEDYYEDGYEGYEEEYDEEYEGEYDESDVPEADGEDIDNGEIYETDEASSEEAAGETAQDSSEGQGYTDDELCKMALDFYESQNGSRPGIAEVDSTEGNKVTIHLYDDMGDHTATAAWYEIDRNTGKGTDTVFGEEVDITGAGSAGNGGSAEGDEGEGADLADGEYVTDEQYSGELSSDGKTMTITTALNHYDKDWNLVPDYEKRTYVFDVADDCKCVTITETEEVKPISEKLDFVQEFLEGKSGLPITLKIKNNKIVEMTFSS